MLPTTISLWDIIVTPSGVAIIIIPPCPRPRDVVIDAGGCTIRTDGAAITMADSARVADILSRARAIVVAEADESPTRETLIGIVDVRRTQRGTSNDRKAA